MTAPEPDPHDEPQAERDRLDLRPLLLQMAGVLVALSLVAALVGLLVHDRAVAWGEHFVATYGMWGVAAGFFVPDATTLLVPPEIFMGLAVAGGMPFWQIVVAGSVGSILGGCTAFVGARLLRRIPWVEQKLAHRAEEYTHLVERYGLLALAAGALTPLPFSLMAWTCGLLGMRFVPFALTSLLRIPRVAIYLLPMWIGFQ
ncbi:MAG: VTT domain-containing protein [Alphaproteobacteria bacterium]|nr:VTT domain-containing protein [Alphaproteobacteria bacterium]